MALLKKERKIPCVHAPAMWEGGDGEPSERAFFFYSFGIEYWSECGSVYRWVNVGYESIVEPVEGSPV